MKLKIFWVFVFFGWMVNFVRAEWSLIDDFEGEQLSGLDIYTTVNPRGAFKSVYIDDPSGALSAVFYSGYYESAGIVSLGFPLPIEEKVEPVSISTVYLVLHGFRLEFFSRR